MSELGTGKAPWHLWAVGVVSLLWNGFSGYDYLMSQTRNQDYMTMMTEPFGFDPQVAMDYFDGFPIWADAAWAFAVWGAIAGSLLLLLRSKWALHSFVVSLAGMAVSIVFSFTHPMPGMTDSPMALGMVVGVFAIALLLVWYCRRQTAAGVLR